MEIIVSSVQPLQMVWTCPYPRMEESAGVGNEKIVQKSSRTSHFEFIFGCLSITMLLLPVPIIHPSLRNKAIKLINSRERKRCRPTQLVLFCQLGLKVSKITYIHYIGTYNTYMHYIRTYNTSMCTYNTCMHTYIHMYIHYNMY